MKLCAFCDRERTDHDKTCPGCGADEVLCRGLLRGVPFYYREEHEDTIEALATSWVRMAGIGRPVPTEELMKELETYEVKR